MFTVNVIYIFWMLWNIHVNTVGGAGGRGWGTAHMDPVHMKLRLRIRHPRLARHLVEAPGSEEAGGRGHAGAGGSNGEGARPGGAAPLPELGLRRG